KYGGEIFEGRHEPLISKKLFDKCREVMSKRGKVQEVRKHNFAFLGLLKCASCGASITAEIQKGHNYYRCTKKKGACQEKHYLREELLSEQIKSFLQKVSLPSQDTEKVLAALDSEQEKAREDAQSEVSVSKEQLARVEAKLQKLLDVYLADALSTDEYAVKKQELLSQKVELQEKITDFEQKGLSWLEPAREFVLSLNQAAKLIKPPIDFFAQNSLQFGRRAKRGKPTKFDFSLLVPRRGLEPPCSFERWLLRPVRPHYGARGRSRTDTLFTAHAPKACVSANFTTRANLNPVF
ncbi:MAG: recombinase, partial [Candidatus Berkelbacteria bacterium Athens1014_28]